MKYHFKIHKQRTGYWAESVELKGCLSQGKNLDELKENLKEALDLYLDEPEDSNVLFPLPKKNLHGKNIATIAVNPQIALTLLVRTERLRKKWTQRVTAKHLGIPLYSYQKLEDSKTANPEWKTVIKLRRVFPNLNLNWAT